MVFGYRRLASGPRIGTPADQLRRTGTGRNDRGRFALAVMTHIIFSDYRNTAAEEAYEIAWDFLTRAGAIRNEFEACVFLAQRIAVMVDQGQTNRIRMANRAISEYQQHADESDDLTRCGGCRGEGR
ncbi:hypothetical protein [Bradyrhizobium sp. SEMIA]|uniref:hypothetical protein n=1 Tax=Bradyrhizobium sp. SEMIA TaxID=2597515 RepID=UPI003A100759